VRVVDSSVQPLQNADAVSVGALHTCAHTKTGAVWCWGQNTFGQLGVGHEGDKVPTATEVPMLNNASLVSAGAVHTCTRKSDFTLWCWGNNSAYQLGISARVDAPMPQYVSALGPIVAAVTTGSFHTCARVGTAAECWGANDQGQLGNGTGSATSSPDIYSIPQLDYHAATMSAGDKHTCATTDSGELWCWGGNDHQQLGTGDGLRYPSPVRILPAGVETVSAGQEHTCAIASGGDLLCWGSNAHGQLGTGDMLQRPTPTRVLSDVVQVSAGSRHTCARRRNGSILCWGANDNGQVGSGPPSPTPVTMPSPVTLSCGP
jgi:alpha-tubulin suppressor-like RCC1 family protein